VRRLVVLVYALVFLTELTQAAIVPLLPTFAAEFSLSDVETGSLLSAMTFATVVVAVPIGMSSDRIGARPLTLAAGGLLALSSLGQALAVDFWTLLAARALFGVAFGIVWTAGLMLVAASISHRRSAAMGGTVAVGGAAHFAGPTFAGFLADLFGVAVPFAVIATAAGLLTLVLVLAPFDRGSDPMAQPLRETLRGIRGERRARSALGLMALIGLVGGIVHLLIPLRLSENGLSAGAIGAIFSTAAIIWIAASAFTARLIHRAVHVSVAGTGALLLGAVFLLPLAALSTAVVVGFLLLNASIRAPLSSIVYPLGATGARIAGIGGGTVLGLLNLAWGVSAVLGPLAGGALSQTAGERWAYFAAVVACLTVGTWILASERRRVSRRPLECVPETRPPS
jgi:DHA1 family inner membrane transport protein